MEADPDRSKIEEQLHLYRDQRLHPVPIGEQKSAGILFMGVGIWFAARFYEDVSLKNFQATFNNVTELLQPQKLAPFGSRPMTADDGVGSELFLAPVPPPFYDGMAEDRKTGVAAVPGEIEAIDEFLQSKEEETRLSMLWSYVALSHDEPNTFEDPKNGYHVTEAVAETKAQIILNLRCNAKLDIHKGYPYSRTCCTDYGPRSPAQLAIVSLGILFCGAVVAIEVYGLLRATKSRTILSEAAVFITGLLLCYWADRTQAFAKGSKEYRRDDFVVLSLVALMIGVAGVTRSRPPPPKPNAQPQAAEPDMKALSRDQTDEWKGWMQAVILIYHWTGASKDLDIYICIRLLVASYLFQTGYGHAVYFVSKNDFSFKRVFSTMLRLNLLSCCLPYIMQTDYMFYYFAPLVSFWFLVVYCTFWIGSQYNDRNLVIVAKIVISALVVAAVTQWTPAMYWVFSFLEAVFHIHWDLREWQFRLALDGCIVYVGALLGVAHVRSKVYHRVLTETHGLVGVIGALSLPLYWLVASRSKDKTAYNAVHPLVSFIPVLGFIAMRNMSRSARTWYSGTFAWLGRCSLETFTLQFHIFLAADTKGLLLLDAFPGDGSFFGDRWRHLVLIVPVFFFVSSQVARATEAITKCLASPVSRPNAALASADAFDLGTEEDAEPMLKRPPPTALTRLATLANDLRARAAILILILWILNIIG